MNLLNITMVFTEKENVSQGLKQVTSGTVYSVVV